MENDLYNEILAKRKELNQATRLLTETGKARAKAEYRYQVLKTSECLKMRDQGMPVGLIEQTVRGIPEVAKVRFKRDVADVNYDANRDHINSLKLELRLLENQLQREWTAAGETL